MTVSSLSKNLLLAAAVLLVSVPLAALARPEGAMSDSIAERVITAWGEQPAGIIVKVNDGVVEMWGEAPSEEAIRAAVQIAHNTVGVQQVVSHLHISGQIEQTAAAR